MSMLPPLADAPAEPGVHGRLLPGEGVVPLWMITLVTFGIWLLIGSIYASVKLASGGQSSPTTQISFTPAETVGMGIVAGAVLLAVMICCNLVARPGGLTAMGLSPRRLVGGVVAGAACAAVIVPLVFGAAYLTQLFWEFIGFEHPSAHPLLRVFGGASSPMLRTLVVVTAVLIAPAYEELLFRGHLQTAIDGSIHGGARRRRRWVAIVVSSLVFALFHGEAWMMPPIFVLSLCLGWIYEWTHNLWVPITVHATFNAGSLAYFLWLLPRH